VYYVGGGFALALFCAIWYLDQRRADDDDWPARTRRRILILTPLGLLHPVVALAAVGLAVDLGRARVGASGALLPAALTATAISIGVAIVALAVTS
jgi:hypothetical protein